MAGHALTTASALTCPHGGTVSITTTNGKVSAADARLATASDTFAVAGCPFQIPGTPPIPSPCVKVVWVTPDAQTKVFGRPTLSESSVGLTLSAAQVPQGPVVVSLTQPNVSTR